VPWLHAVLLGIVQGLTEFLPISSSGHLIVVPWLFDWNHFEDPGTAKAFDVALHLGTLFAVVAYYRRDLNRLICAGALHVVDSNRRSADGRLAWLLFASSVPAAAVGALLESWIDGSLGTPVIIAISMVAFGLLLAAADRREGERSIGEFSLRDAVLVGAAQVLAFNPGTSRSGITMTASRFLGFSRVATARLSFLMSVPVISGAIAYKLVSLDATVLPEGFVTAIVIGVVSSAVSGWLAVWGLVRLVSMRGLGVFVVYRIVFGAIVLSLVALR
jgi:undecaprenyl-diphosphatase